MKKKRRRHGGSSSDSDLELDFDAALFPLLLAAASSGDDGLVRRLLGRVRRWLVRSRRALPPSLLSLFPLLLSRSPGVAAGLLGAASLLSLQHNHAIASDAALLRALTSSLSEHVLPALMDLSVSSFARERLRDAGVLHRLL